MSIYMKFGQKFNDIRLVLQLTLKELGQLLFNKSESYMGHIIRGEKIPSDLLFKNIVEIFKQKQIPQADIDELIELYEEAKKQQAINKIQDIKKKAGIPDRTKVPPPMNEYNLETDAMPVQKIPVISWVHAGQWTDVSCVSAVLNDDFEEYIYTSAKGEKLFALRVKDDCMEPVFSDGDIIVVNINISPENGNYVIAKNVDTQETTFKQFKVAGEYKYLHPLNSKYDDIPLNSKHKIIGKVIETIRKH